MANEKILVVDDDANICELLRLYLTKELSLIHISTRWAPTDRSLWTTLSTTPAAPALRP